VRIFLAGTSLLPEYGGPAFSVSRLAIALAQAGVEVGLWAADQSTATTPLISSESSVYPIIGTEAEALEKFGRADVLHDNGIWLPHHRRLAKLAETRGIPRVVSTRGMLEPWAMKHKRAKKTLAWWLYQRRDLSRAECHHTTAEIEAKNVRRLRLGVEVRVICNGVDLPKGVRGRKKPILNQTRQRIALFLGRIYPVKGLPMLINAWARVRPNGWVLQIAGPDEAGHRGEVESAISRAGLNDAISFLGPVSGQAKQTTFFEADLFVLPTHSESFGMAVAEALAHGLPVLTTKGAPWPMLPERHCGWWVDATVDGLAEGLRQATSQDSATLQAMGARGCEVIAAQFGWANVAKKFIVMYEELMTKGPYPEGAVAIDHDAHLPPTRPLSLI
jgi:glycosyltransferase involved in cell wall biosynthesis